MIQRCAALQVRCGLEAPDSGTYQQRVGHMRLLGEMYNFRLVDSRFGGTRPDSSDLMVLC